MNRYIFCIVINGNWGPWEGLSSCSASCGLGTQTKSRYCNSPNPENGGLACLLSNGMRATRETLTSSCQLRQCLQGNKSVNPLFCLHIFITQASTFQFFKLPYSTFHRYTIFISIDNAIRNKRFYHDRFLFFHFDFTLTQGVHSRNRHSSAYPEKNLRSKQNSIS